MLRSSIFHPSRRALAGLLALPLLGGTAVAQEAVKVGLSRHSPASRPNPGRRSRAGFRSQSTR
jgi:hypothetical protein